MTRRRALWLCVAALCAVCHGAAAQAAGSNEPEERTADSAGVALQQQDVPEFVPTKEWQDVLPGQSLPPGLHIRLNFETGRREAKFLDEEETGVVAVAEEETTREVTITADTTDHANSVTVSTDVSGEINAASVSGGGSNLPGDALIIVESSKDQEEEEEENLEIAEPTSEDNAVETDTTKGDVAHEPDWNHEKIYEVLAELPEPPLIDGMDIHEARAKLAQPEFRRHMIAVWKKRQEELKEAIDSLQDDAQFLAKLLGQFSEAEKEGNTEEQLRVLEELEWEVQDLDKTHVFNFIGGFDVIADYLNSTNLPVRAHASWLVGTAVKNYKDGQDWAINAGVIPMLLQTLAMPLNADVDTVFVQEVSEAKKKAIYALSSLVRFNPRGQRLFLAHEGPQRLALVLDGHHPFALQLKAALFVHDLLLEHDMSAAQIPTDESGAEVDAEDAEALKKLHAAFQSNEWCRRLAGFLQTHVSRLQRHQAAEVMDAMRVQLPSCQNEFEDSGAREMIATLSSEWTTDENLDEDEREHLVARASAVLARL